MFAVALTVILAVQLAPVSGSGSRIESYCKHPFKIVGHSCLLYSENKRHYDQAKKDCEKKYDGYLVTPDTSERRKDLKKFVKTNGVTGDDFEYIGGKEIHKIFKWRGASTAAFWERNDPHAHPDIKSSWRRGEPDNTNGNEQCVCIKDDGLWNDCKCKAFRHYICEKRH